jgi:mono/diheme cytochrome c family protein/plastocyanin
MRGEWTARLIVISALAVVLAIPGVGWWRASREQAIMIHARMAESGGWTPENLTVAVGQPLHLRLSSDDVTHGFAVGQLDQPAVDINPGEVTDITLVFQKPGKYTFYCTRWCSVNHWRMRGTIEVTSPVASTPAPATPPLYIRLGLNIDADHHAASIPANIPSAWRGALLNRIIPESYTNRGYYLTHTPVDLWSTLRSETNLKDLSDQEIWDLVAWAWQSNTTQAEILEGQKLFAANCAACHGMDGSGNGVFAEQLVNSDYSSDSSPAMGEHTLPPAKFTDPDRMLSASPALLQGKIIRGGMGTGMPYWGPIFTEEQTWAIVAYLWTFQFPTEVVK